MKPREHAAVSTMAAGALYAATGSPAAAASCFLSGILIDLDHLLDFVLLAEERFTPKAFLGWCYRGGGPRLLLPLHSYELFLLLVLAAARGMDPAAWGAVAGVGIHLAMDQYGNRDALPGLRLRRGFYFLAWRASVGFKKERLSFPGASKLPGS